MNNELRRKKESMSPVLSGSLLHHWPKTDYSINPAFTWKGWEKSQKQGMCRIGTRYITSLSQIYCGTNLFGNIWIWDAVCEWQVNGVLHYSSWPLIPEQWIHAVSGTVSANDVAYRWVQICICGSGWYLYSSNSSSGTSQLPGPVPTDLLSLGSHLQPSASWENE